MLNRIRNTAALILSVLPLIFVAVTWRQFWMLGQEMMMCAQRGWDAEAQMCLGFISAYMAGAFIIVLLSAWAARRVLSSTQRKTEDVVLARVRQERDAQLLASATHLPYLKPDRR